MCLSIPQPLAWAVADGHMDVENRDWRTPPSYRGLLLIHASQREFLGGVHCVRRILGREPPTGLPRGGLVAMVRLVEIIENHGSPWAQEGRLHLVFADAIALPYVPMRGMHGISEVGPSVLGRHRDAYLDARSRLLEKARAA